MSTAIARPVWERFVCPSDCGNRSCQLPFGTFPVSELVCSPSLIRTRLLPRPPTDCSPGPCIRGWPRLKGGSARPQRAPQLPGRRACPVYASLLFSPDECSPRAPARCCCDQRGRKRLRLPQAVYRKARFAASAGRKVTGLSKVVAIGDGLVTWIDGIDGIFAIGDWWVPAKQEPRTDFGNALRVGAPLGKALVSGMQPPPVSRRCRHRASMMDDRLPQQAAEPSRLTPQVWSTPALTE